MLFTSMVTPVGPHGQDVFCIELDDAELAYIRQQRAWMNGNAAALDCEFKLSNLKARFVERGDYDEMVTVPYDHLHGEDPLEYYRHLVNRGKPNVNYWDCTCSKPDEVWLWLTRNSVGFRFRDAGDLYYSNGSCDSDFFSGR